MTQQERLAAEPAMAEKIQAFDWGSTSMGPPSRWPWPLRSAVDALLASSMAQCLAWGPQMSTLYNDAFADLLRDPALRLGMGFNDIWQDAWSAIGPLAHRAYHGRSTLLEDFQVPLERDGAMQQRYFTLCNSPVRDEHGMVRGILVTVVDTTRRVLREQQLSQDVARLQAERDRQAAEAQRLWRLSPDMMLVLDDSGRVSAINPAFTQALGWRETDIVGQPLGCLAPPEQTRFQAQLLRLAPGAAPWELDALLRTRSGEFLHTRWKVERHPQKVHAWGQVVTVDAPQPRLPDGEPLARPGEAAHEQGVRTGSPTRHAAADDRMHALNNQLHVLVANLSLLERTATEPQLRYIRNAQQAARASVELATAAWAGEPVQGLTQAQGPAPARGSQRDSRALIDS